MIGSGRELVRVKKENQEQLDALNKVIEGLEREKNILYVQVNNLETANKILSSNVDTERNSVRHIATGNATALRVIDEENARLKSELSITQKANNSLTAEKIARDAQLDNLSAQLEQSKANLEIYKKRHKRIKNALYYVSIALLITSIFEIILHWGTIAKLLVIILQGSVGSN